MSFGSNLSTLRKSRGLSQEDFGEKLGVSRQTIYTWEGDISSPNIENLQCIAEYFGCTVDDLINGTATASDEEVPPFCTGDKATITSIVHAFAFRIAIATLLILIGVAAFSLFAESSIEIVGFAVFFVLLAIAVFLYIYGGVTYGNFTESDENKNRALLYTKEEKQAENKSFAFILAAAVGGIIADVLMLCVIYNTIENENTVWPASLFLTILGVCVFFIINSSIRLSKYENDQPKPDNKKESLFHSILWMVTVMVYLTLGLGFDLWHPGWIIFVIAGFLSGIFGIVFDKNEK